VPKGALFVSFAESDGGHSYLAARAMLAPAQVGHLLFRNTVSEALDALVGGQSNFAVVPFYNSITQWEGATVKALASGQFEIFAQTCMQTSYVLAAHREHINMAIGLYAAERNIPQENLPDFTRLDDWLKGKCDRYAIEFPNSTEEERRKYEEREVESAKETLKTYTRLLTTIYVGAQADEQYRGRLLRPDMNKVDIDLTRNPLRVLEEVNRSDLMKSMARSQGTQSQPVYPGAGGMGTSPYAPINVFGPAPLLKDFKGPAALVAKGLMDPPGDLHGWDKPGSLGEIVALLRKLQVLLDVYSFGPPDLPDNKTQYLLLGRRGELVRPTFEEIPEARNAPLRTMILIKPAKATGKNRWIQPRSDLQDLLGSDMVLDRPPLMVAGPDRTVFLQEGGRLKSQLFSSSIDSLADKLRKTIDRKPSESGAGWFGGTAKLEALFLGIYPTWVSKSKAERDAEHAGKKCDDWLCGPAEDTRDGAAPLPSWFWPLVLAAILAAVLVYAWLAWAAACQDVDSVWCGDFEWPAASTTPPPPSEPEPSEKPPVDVSPSPPPPATGTPGIDTRGVLPSPSYPTGASPAPASRPPVAGPPPYAAPPEPTFHVPFFEAKANLLPDAQTALRDAAARALETDKVVKLRVFALGPRENDDALWQRRYQAVKDELVRLGVPADRIMREGAGPYDVVIRQRVVKNSRTSRERMTLEVIPDPLDDEDDDD
jgi:outer membrane protein OmpA-like peptidoglycan-associated protein